MYVIYDDKVWEYGQQSGAMVTLSNDDDVKRVSLSSIEAVDTFVDIVKAERELRRRLLVELHDLEINLARISYSIKNHAGEHQISEVEAELLLSTLK
jgi:hypothetical protein